MNGNSYQDTPPDDAMANLNISVSTNRNHSPVTSPQWRDITSFVDQATEDFNVGQLVHLSTFTLFDAMSAIEIMDPKMDTGMRGDDYEQAPFDVTRRLEADELLWVMDRLLTCEMAWISGVSLSQSIYTSVHYHHLADLVQQTPANPSRLDDILFSSMVAYLLGIARCCQHVWTEMKAGNVYEDEDFSTNLFGLAFYDQYSDTDVINSQEAAVHSLKKWMDEQEQGSNHLLIQGIIDRLEIRKSFLLVLRFLALPRCAGTQAAKAELSKMLDKVKLHIPKSISKGKPVDGAFDLNIHRKLSSQTPPRPIPLKTEKESYSDLTHMLTRLESMCSVMNYTSVDSLICYFMFFAAKQPYADPFTRSKLSTLFYHNNSVFGTKPVHDMVIDAVARFTMAPGDLINVTPDHEYQPLVDTFMNHACTALVDFFKIQCQNRSRQRRVLSKILNEWDRMQDEASDLDEIVHDDFSDIFSIDIDELLPHYYTCWTFHMKLTMMESVLTMGCELQLYSDYELPMVFWYLKRVLTQHEAVYERACGFTEMQLIANPPRRKRGPKTLERPHPLDRHLRIRQMFTQAKGQLAEGIFNMLQFAEKKRILNHKQPRYDDPETRFNHRFKNFDGLLAPEEAKYKDFHREMYGSASPSELLKASEPLLNSTRQLMEWVAKEPAENLKAEMCPDDFKQDVMGIMRTCVANRVTLTHLQSDLTSPPMLQVNFKYHPQWPVLEAI